MNSECPKCATGKHCALVYAGNFPDRCYCCGDEEGEL